MNSTNNQIDVKRGCSVYSSLIQKALNDLFRIEVAGSPSAESVAELEPKEDLNFSILFTGQIYGEFLFGLSKRTAVMMLEASVDEVFAKNRLEIMDTLKEVINVAAGTTLAEFKATFRSSFRRCFANWAIKWKSQMTGLKLLRT